MSDCFNLVAAADDVGEVLPDTLSALYPHGPVFGLEQPAAIYLDLDGSGGTQNYVSCPVND